MNVDQCLRELIQEVPDRSPRGLAETVFRMIRSGQLRTGDRLPTVRTTAAHLGMSPSSVAEAWRTMLDAQAIETRRRGGTFVVGPPTPATPVRYEKLLESARGMAELGRPSADPLLWPDPERAFAWSVAESRVIEHQPIPITPALHDAVRPSWPFTPGALMATNGGLDGLALALRTLVAPGERVLVSDPTEIIVLDLLDSMRCLAVPIPHDEHGPRPDVLARELASDPPLFIHQSGPSTPLGRTTSKSRMGELAAVIKGHPTHVVELCPYPYFTEEITPSIGWSLPDQVVHLRWYGRSHGADILVGVAGGPREVLRRMWLVRGYQAQWTSRYLQNALAYLLTDAEAVETVETAGQVYDRRREGLVSALARAGIESRSDSGTSVWIPVPDEDAAWLSLAQQGYAAQRGSDFYVEQSPQPHLRISIASYRDDLDALAQALIRACTRADPFSG